MVAAGNNENMPASEQQVELQEIPLKKPFNSPQRNGHHGWHFSEKLLKSRSVQRVSPEHALVHHQSSRADDSKHGAFDNEYLLVS